MATTSTSFISFTPTPFLCSWKRSCTQLHHHRLPFSGKCEFYRRRSLFSKNTSTSRVLCSQVKVEDGVDDDDACELVNGVELKIGEGEDGVGAYLLKAVKNNNGIGLLLLSDVFGFEDSFTRDFAYRVACNGYNVLVPDLFRGNPWKMSKPRSEFDQWLARQGPERVSKDINVSAKWMVDEFMAAGISSKLGIIGFCFGGGHLIETLAFDEQSCFGTGVCFYGTQMSTTLAKNVKVPVLFICGDVDPLCPLSELRAFEKIITDSRVVIYSGRGHGFAHRPDSLEEDEDAEDAFSIMKNWLHESLVLSKDLVH